MKTVVFSLILTATMSTAQESATRVVLVNSNIPNGAIYREVNDRCHGLIVTSNAAKADLALEAQVSTEQANHNEHTWLTLFNKDGDVVFATETRSTGNAVKDVCEFLKLRK
jgi:hypothetical protein